MVNAYVFTPFTWLAISLKCCQESRPLTPKRTLKPETDSRNDENEPGDETVLDKFKYLYERLVARFEGNLAVQPSVSDIYELERTRKRLAQMRFRTGETSNTLDLTTVRKRITGEIDSDAIAVRQRRREAINKWCRKEDQYDSGSFDTTELNRRMEEAARKEIYEVQIEPLPDLEDTFMAFSRPEEDLFEEESVTLSGVHGKIDLEDLDDYSIPMLPRFRNNDLDFAPMSEVAQAYEANSAEQCQAIDCSPETVEEQSHSMSIIRELENRLSEQKKNDAFSVWLVGDGD